MDQEEICRVCRCEGSIEQPLFHPCKCSGSIRYVHQECLMTWLSHSRKAKCELCGHRYSFSPVYHMDMPDSIPIRLFVLQFGKKLFNLLCMTLRGCLVTCMWLFVLPYFTLTVWRFYFWTGQLLGDKLRLLQNYSSPVNQLYGVSNQKNVTAAAITTVTSFVSTVVSHTLENQSSFNQSSTNAITTTQFTVFGQTFQVSTIKAFLADCVEGQVITFIVVAVFISIFHLREWIVVNIPEEVPENLGGDPMAIVDEDDRQDDRPQQEQLLQNHQLPPLEPAFEQQDQQNDNILNDNQEPHVLEHDDDRLQYPFIIEYQEVAADAIHFETRHWDRRATSEPPHPTQHQQYYLDDVDDDDNDVDDEGDDDEPMTINNNRQYRAASAQPVMNPYTSSHHFADDFPSPSGLQRRTTPIYPTTYLPIVVASSSNRQLLNEQHDDDNQDQIHILEHHRRHRARLQVPTPVLQPAPQDALPQLQEPAPPLLQIPALLQPPPPPPQFPELPIQIPMQLQPPPPPPQFQEPPIQIPVQLQPPPPPLRFEDFEDLVINDAGGNAADDVLDILDAIGMQGSLWTLVQNVVIIGMVICSSIAVTIWLPYLIGMTFVMADIFEVVWVPLLLTRIVTDPIIDWLATFFMDTAWPTTSIYLASLTEAAFNYYTITTPTLIQDVLATLADQLTRLLSSVSSRTMIENGNIESNPSLQHLSGSAFSLCSLESIFDTLLQWANQAKPTVMSIVAWYQHLAVGTSVVDRGICIVIGYILALAMSSCYVSQALATMMFGDRAQGTLRQQYLILKVGLFLVVELFVFPSTCGVLLDFSTLPLLQDDSSSPSLNLVWRRLDYMSAHMYISMFIYWFVGSGFMLMFAWIVTSCRAIFRPGVLWFISDHNDPQFHPVKEIVQRPVWNHLEKLAISAVMYSTIIVLGIGGSLQSILYFVNTYLPLPWNVARPTLVIPFDLLVVQLIISAVIQYFPPMQTIKHLYVSWMRFLCRQLRLTCFMFGIRTMDEEGMMRYDTWSGWFRGTVLQQQDDAVAVGGTLVWDGQLVRAPKRDGVKYIPGRRMLVPVDRMTLLPLDERDQRLGHPAAFQGVGGEDANTVVVYMPPQFKQRVSLLIMFLWVFGCLLISFLTIAPLVLGRLIIKDLLNVEIPVPDMCSYLGGIALMLMMAIVIDHSVTVIREVVSYSSTSDRLHILGQHFAEISRRVGKWILFIISFNVILPLLIGLMIEMHFIFPWQDFGDNIPVFAVESIWIRGFGLMNVMHGVLLILPANPLQAGLTRVFRNGITNMDTRYFCINILLPAYMICIYMLLMPFMFGLLVNSFLVKEDIALEIKNMQLAYPICLGGLLVFSLTNLGLYFSERWVESIRDDHFLVGRTLHNMDD